MDTVYPEPIRLRLGVTTRRQKGPQSRYRTQPVTFSEIKEVDEENSNDDDAEIGRRMSAEAPQVMSSKSSSNVNAKYEELWSRRRADRKINKKAQKKLDLSKTPSVSSIPGSPEKVSDNSENQCNLSTLPPSHQPPSQTLSQYQHQIN